MSPCTPRAETLSYIKERCIQEHLGKRIHQGHCSHRACCMALTSSPRACASIAMTLAASRMPVAKAPCMVAGYLQQQARQQASWTSIVEDHFSHYGPSRRHSRCLLDVSTTNRTPCCQPVDTLDRCRVLHTARAAGTVSNGNHFWHTPASRVRVAPKAGILSLKAVCMRSPTLWR